MAKKILLRVLCTMAVALASGCVATAEEDSERSESAVGTSPGKARPQRFVLLQAEADASQQQLFRSFPNATVLSSYEAGIYWTAKDAVPTVQAKLDALIDAGLARVEADLAAKEKAASAEHPARLYEETIILGLAGHSGGTSFFGHSVTAAGNTNRVQILPADVARLATKYPHFARNVRGLFLLGCNAGHKDKMDLWRQPFANVAAVAGFNSRAPDGESGGNVLVKWSLGEWQRLGILNAGATVSGDDAVLFKGIASCRTSKCLGVMTQATWGGPGNFVVQGSPAWELVVDGRAHWDAVFPPDGPSTVLAKIHLLQREYDAYLGAVDAAHADPPSDTSSGLARQYNNLSQQYLSVLGGPGSASDLARARQSIRLTLFRDVKQAWLGDNAAVVQTLGLDPRVLSTLTRRDLLRTIRELPEAKRQSAEGRRLVKAMVELDPTEIVDAML